MNGLTNAKACDATDLWLDAPSAFFLVVGHVIAFAFLLFYPRSPSTYLCLGFFRKGRPTHYDASFIFAGFPSGSDDSHPVFETGEMVGGSTKEAVSGIAFAWQTF